MKSLKYILISGMALASMGCEDFLEKEPLDSYAVNSFYQTKEQVEQAVNGIYASFYFDGMYRRNMWIAQEIGSDNAYFDGANAFDDYNLTPTNGESGDIYRDHWRGIVRAQYVINKLPQSKIMDEATKKRYEGEARFVNALLYFNLVRYFGDVPVIKNIPTYETSFQVERNPADQVYDEVIIPDLEFAIQNLLPKQTDKGRATQGAAQALLAKVHLTRGNYAQVLPLTQAVMQSGLYSLEPNYADNFKLSNENGKESLFEIQYYNEYNYGGQQWQFWSPSGWGFKVTENLAQAYKTINTANGPLTDTRRTANLILPGDTVAETGYTHPATSKVILARKYANLKAEQVSWLSQPLNDKVLRYSDVLLMHAEAENMVNGPATALEYVNKVRRRAYGLSIDTPSAEVDLAASSEEALDEAILEERRLEFALESQRWFDLVRKGKAIQLLNGHKNAQDATAAKSITESDLLFPIPQGEIDINPKLSQNPGY